MPSPVEQAIQSLLPTTNIVPTQLVSLANSLLAQSKHAAPTLKQEEEIARTYTCCHLACKRLANKLTLDLGKLNPPCGPRVYKKLHSFLDGVLTAGTASQPVTPRNNRTIDVLQTKTPTSARSAQISKFRTPSKDDQDDTIVVTRTPKASAKRKREASKDEDIVPVKVARLSQHICKCMRLPEAAPHVYAGLEAALPRMSLQQNEAESQPPSNKRSRKQSSKALSAEAVAKADEVEAEKVSLLVLALFHRTYNKMKDVEFSRGETLHAVEEMVAFLREDDDSQAERLARKDSSDIADAIDVLSDQLRTESFWQDWHDNITTLDADDRHAPAQEVVLPHPAKTPLRRKEKRRAPDEDDLPGAAGLLPGLGTMFQPAFDWLSDERQAEYEVWAQGVMQEIASIEQEV